MSLGDLGLPVAQPWGHCGPEALVPVPPEHLRALLRQRDVELDAIKEERRDKDAAICFLKTKIASLQNQSRGEAAGVGEPAASLQGGDAGTWPVGGLGGGSGATAACGAGSTGGSGGDAGLCGEVERRFASGREGRRIDELEHQLDRAQLELEACRRSAVQRISSASVGWELEDTRRQVAEGDREVERLQSALERQEREARSICDRSAADLEELRQHFFARDQEVAELRRELANHDGDKRERLLEEENRLLAGQLDQALAEGGDVRAQVHGLRRENSWLWQELHRFRVDADAVHASSKLAGAAASFQPHSAAVRSMCASEGTELQLPRGLDITRDAIPAAVAAVSQRSPSIAFGGWPTSDASPRAEPLLPQRSPSAAEDKFNTASVAISMAAPPLPQRSPSATFEGGFNTTTSAGTTAAPLLPQRTPSTSSEGFLIAGSLAIVASASDAGILEVDKVVSDGAVTEVDCAGLLPMPRSPSPPDTSPVAATATAHADSSADHVSPRLPFQNAESAHGANAADKKYLLRAGDLQFKNVTEKAVDNSSGADAFVEEDAGGDSCGDSGSGFAADIKNSTGVGKFAGADAGDGGDAEAHRAVIVEAGDVSPFPVFYADAHATVPAASVVAARSTEVEPEPEDSVCAASVRSSRSNNGVAVSTGESGLFTISFFDDQDEDTAAKEARRHQLAHNMEKRRQARASAAAEAASAVANATAVVAATASARGQAPAVAELRRRTVCEGNGAIGDETPTRHMATAVASSLPSAPTTSRLAPGESSPSSRKLAAPSGGAVSKVTAPAAGAAGTSLAQAQAARRVETVVRPGEIMDSPRGRRASPAHRRPSSRGRSSGAVAVSESPRAAPAVAAAVLLYGAMAVPQLPSGSSGFSGASPCSSPPLTSRTDMGGTSSTTLHSRFAGLRDEMKRRRSTHSLRGQAPDATEVADAVMADATASPFASQPGILALPPLSAGQLVVQPLSPRGRRPMSPMSTSASASNAPAGERQSALLGHDYSALRAASQGYPHLSLGVPAPQTSPGRISAVPGMGAGSAAATHPGGSVAQLAPRPMQPQHASSSGSPAPRVHSATGAAASVAGGSGNVGGSAIAQQRIRSLPHESGGSLSMRARSPAAGEVAASGELDRSRRNLSGLSARSFADAHAAAAAAIASVGSRSSLPGAVPRQEQATAPRQPQAGAGAMMTASALSGESTDADVLHEAVLRFCAQQPAGRCPLYRLSRGAYLYGSKKIVLAMQNDKLMARIGGGFVNLESLLLEADHGASGPSSSAAAHPFCMAPRRPRASAG